MNSFKHTLGQALRNEAQRRYRFLIVNEHYLSHASVHRLFCQALKADPQVDFERGRDTVELDTVSNLLERIQRRIASLRFGTAWMQQQGLDLARWRFQRYVALLARKRVLKKLEQAQKEGRPYDAIAFHSQTAAFACTDLMCKIPCLVSTDITNRQASEEWNIPATRWTYAPSTRCERSVFRHARIIATFSDWARQAILAENPWMRAERVRHYPPGAELQGFLALPLKHLQTRQAPSPKTRLLFVGGDFERKGGHDVLAAFEHLQDTCELHIVSNAAPMGIERPGVQVYRDIKPYSPELIAQYAQADIFVLPTRNEAFGHVFVEAQAAGLPIVSTRINAIPELIQETGHELLILPGDREALENSTRKLADNRHLRQALAETGRHWVITHYDARSCFERYVRGLKEICG